MEYFISLSKEVQSLPDCWVTAQSALPRSPCRCALQSKRSSWGGCCAKGPSAEADNGCCVGSSRADVPPGVRGHVCDALVPAEAGSEVIYLEFLLETARFSGNPRGRCILCPLFS